MEVSHRGGSELELTAKKSVDVGLPAPFGVSLVAPMPHTTCREKALSCLPCPSGRQSHWAGEGLDTWAPRPPTHRSAGRAVREWSVPALSCQGLLHCPHPAHTLAWKMPVSARAGGDLEQPLKVSRQLNLIKLQLQKPAAFS